MGNYLLDILDTEAGVHMEEATELGNIFSQQQETIHKSLEDQGERSTQSKYNLRSHPKRSFKLAQAKIIKSILKSGAFQQHPTIDDMVLLDKAQIRATNQDISHHMFLNKKDFKRKEFNLHEILMFKFKDSLSNLLSSYNKWLPVRQPNKSFGFTQIENDTKVILRKLNLNFENLELLILGYHSQEWVC